MTHRVIVFFGPSAVGKTHIAKLLVSTYPTLFEQARLYTTRLPRKNEITTDRLFVSDKEFSRMTQQNAFVLQDEFGGNRYGYTQESFQPKDKHLLINAWPWLIPQISQLEQCILIGMQAPTDWQFLLTSRMIQRGDSKETIEKRIELIQKDQQDLIGYSSLVKNSGAYFIIKDDSTVPDQIIPWIKHQLNVPS